MNKEDWNALGKDDPFPIKLSTKEFDDVQVKLKEMKSLEETNQEFRKLTSLAVARLRYFAKTAEDLAINLYNEASAIEDKARTL